MQPALFDASIYISALRRGNEAILGLLQYIDSPLWLSAVVLEELYAGVNDRNRRVIEQLERDFDTTRRFLVPNLSDWTQAGRVLASLASNYDYELIGRGRLTNDALIAVSAGRLGIRVMTANQKDFRRLAEFCDFQWHMANV